MLRFAKRVPKPKFQGSSIRYSTIEPAKPCQANQPQSLSDTVAYTFTGTCFGAGVGIITAKALADD